MHDCPQVPFLVTSTFVFACLMSVLLAACPCALCPAARDELRDCLLCERGAWDAPQLLVLRKRPHTGFLRPRPWMCSGSWAVRGPWRTLSVQRSALCGVVWAGALHGPDRENVRSTGHGQERERVIPRTRVFGSGAPLSSFPPPARAVGPSLSAEHLWVLPAGQWCQDEKGGELGGLHTGCTVTSDLEAKGQPSRVT